MTAAKLLIDYLRELGWHISLAESCTGGSLAAAITDTPGASDVFRAGFVTYSVGAKRHLANYGEHKELHKAIDEYGVYSPETALAMANAARIAGGRSEVAIGITGMFTPGHPSCPDDNTAVVDVALVIQGGKSERPHLAVHKPIPLRFTFPQPGMYTRQELKERVIGMTLAKLNGVLRGIREEGN